MATVNKNIYTNTSNEHSKSYKNLLSLGLTVLTLTGVAVNEVLHRISEPKTREVSMQVQPFDNPTTVVQRAENKFGKDSGDFSVPQEASAVANEYGTLHVGERLKVHVK